MKDTYGKLIANIIHNGEKLKALPIKIRNKTRCSFHHHQFKYQKSSLKYQALRKKKKGKGTFKLGRAIFPHCVA